MARSGLGQVHLLLVKACVLIYVFWGGWQDESDFGGARERKSWGNYTEFMKD